MNSGIDSVCIHQNLPRYSNYARVSNDGISPFDELLSPDTLNYAHPRRLQIFLRHSPKACMNSGIDSTCIHQQLPRCSNYSRVHRLHFFLRCIAFSEYTAPRIESFADTIASDLLYTCQIALL